MAETGMLYCICGYSCGTKAALNRHIQKFSDAGVEAGEHERDPEPISPLKRRTVPPGLMEGDAVDSDATTPTMSHTSSEPASPATPTSPATPMAPSSFFPRTQCSPEKPLVAPERSGPLRLILVRHAQSANKCRRPGQQASSDPYLSDFGYEQADALGYRLAKDFANAQPGELLVVSSPMRRCLLTVQPAVQRLKLPSESCMCHGACYEYGCAGCSFMGSSPKEIARDFPEFSPVGFSDQGTWDYIGSSDKENEEECRERAIRFVQWLVSETSAGSVRTVVLSTHQTVADLLCHLLVFGDPGRWSYGDIRHRLQNAGMTELFLTQSGRANFGCQNDTSHLVHLGRQPSRTRFTTF